METHCGQQGHFGDALLRAIDEHRWGVTAKSLTTSPPALALHTYKLTHIVHALCVCFGVYESFTSRGYEFLYARRTLQQSSKMPCKQLFTRTPSPAWQITSSLVDKSICVKPHGYLSVLVNYVST